MLDNGGDVDEDGDGFVAKYPHLVRETLGGTLHGRALITMLIMSSTGVYPKHCIHCTLHTELHTLRCIVATPEEHAHNFEH